MHKGIILGSIFGFILLVTVGVIFLLNHTVYKTKPFYRDILTASPTNSVVSSVITVKPLRSGNLVVPLSNPVNLKHPSSSTLKNETVQIPFFSYLIHHEQYGYFLIDSGCDASYIDNPFGPMKGLLLPLVMPETTLKPENAIDAQIGDIKNEIKGVFFTHLHFDHTSGLPSLPDKLIYVAGKGEKSFYIPGLLEPNHFKKSDVVYLLDFDSDMSQNHPLGKAIDVFGDQSLLAIATPGHSKGHVSYLVNQKDHPIFIAGDAVTMNLCLDLRVGSGTSSQNQKLDQKTLEAICNYAEAHFEVEIWPGHDYPSGTTE